MGHRPFNDPLSGSPTGQVDVLLGSAYDVVRRVSHHIKDVCNVSRHMHDVRTVANEVMRTRFVTSIAPVLGGQVSIPLPAYVTLDNLRSFSVLIVTATGEAYSLGDTIFTARFVAGNLIVAISPSAPADVVGGQIRWTVSYKGDLHEPR